MRKTYQGKYDPINRAKYIGNPNNVTYRSMWERNVFRWLDLNDDVIGWNSEETVIPYVCPTDNKIHRYFVDLTIKYKTGNVVLVEIKPESQTRIPVATKNKRKRTLREEQDTYAKNDAKWEAANKYAMKNNCKFQIWTENVLQAIGIPLTTNERYTRNGNRREAKK